MFISLLGKGSFGRVFLARHRLTGQFYALKAMSIPAIIEKHQVDHVHNEKRILQQLDHPFIVKLYVFPFVLKFFKNFGNCFAILAIFYYESFFKLVFGLKSGLGHMLF